jgi:hypothetical protein
VALLLILLLLFGFVLAGFGSGSSSTTEIAPPVKCSKRMTAKAPTTQDQRRCGPPPANP